MCVCAPVCGKNEKKRESLAGGLASTRGGFSGLLVGSPSNLASLHLGSPPKRVAYCNKGSANEGPEQIAPHAGAHPQCPSS